MAGAKHRDETPRQGARGKRYQVNTMVDVAGVSRSMLYYYEKAGIVAPTRDESSNYRAYSNEDVFRVFTCDMLRNIGFSLEEVRELLGSADLDAASFAQACVRRNDREREWHEACSEALEHLRFLVTADPDEVHLELASRWLIYLTQCEEGFDNFDTDDVASGLFRRLPVAARGFVVDGDFFAKDAMPWRWGIAVPERWAHLFPEQSSTEPDYVLGGCPCVVTPYIVPVASIPAFQERDDIRRRLAAFLDANQLRQAGRAYAMNAFSIHENVYLEIHLPVEACGMRGRRLIKEIRRGCDAPRNRGR